MGTLSARNLRCRLPSPSPFPPLTCVLCCVRVVHASEQGAWRLAARHQRAVLVQAPFKPWRPLEAAGDATAAAAYAIGEAAVRAAKNALYGEVCSCSPWFEDSLCDSGPGGNA